MNKQVNGEWVPMEASEIEQLEALQALLNTASTDDFTRAVAALLDLVAQQRRYDSALSLSTYTTSENAIWAEEAKTFVAWRNAAWAYCYTAIDEIDAGTRGRPTVQEFLAELPLIEWPVDLRLRGF